MSAIYEVILSEIEADSYEVMQHRILLTMIRKLWVSWRINMREKYMLF